MRNNKLLISLILGLFALTILLAWYSAERANSEIVFAQSGPFPSGCISAVNEETDCSCTGFTDSFRQTDPTGIKGIVTQDSTCRFPHDPPGSCTVSSSTAVDNPPCCDMVKSKWTRPSRCSFLF